MTNETTKRRADYTEGSVMGAIVKMGLPSMFGFMSQNIYSFVDTYWVSRLPDKEGSVAAVTFFGTILWFFFSFNQLVGPGSVAIISRRYGEKQYDEAEKAIKETVVLKLSFGILFGLAGYLLVEEMLKLLGADGAALLLGIEYGQIMFLGMAVLYATYSIFTAMRGVANPKMAMILMIFSNLLNMVLDPIFIFGYLGLPALGIRGAAFASVLSFALTLAIGLGLFYGDCTNVRLRLKGARAMALRSMWKIVKIGVPTWLGEISFSGARLVITPLIATFGTGVVAAYGVGNQITSFGLMILVGIGLGLSSLIGHNIGAGKRERARRTADRAILLGAVTMVVMGVLAALLAPQIMDLFFDNPATIAIGVTMLRILAVGFPFIGIFLMIEEIHIGVGLNTPAMVINIIHSWPLEVVPIVILTRLFGFPVEAIWWTIALSGAISAWAFHLYYRRGRWLTARV